MTTPHTSGPWHVLAGTAKVLAGKIHPFGYEGFPIAWPARGVNRKEALANARLISAAPDLLNALRGALFFVPVGAAARINAESAIDKATQIS